MTGFEPVLPNSLELGVLPVHTTFRIASID